MPTTKELLSTLNELWKHYSAVSDQLAALDPSKFFEGSLYEQREARLKKERDDVWEEMEYAVGRFERFPDRNAAFYQHLPQFYEAAPLAPPSKPKVSYDNSVFLMTKFPIDGDPEAPKLRQVIETVKAAVLDAGCYPRIASEKDHHEWLWANVELYLLGCSRGIAIVEDRYRSELNPNVAMEWGWMRGMGRRVLFLREKAFRNDRADWSGLTQYEFDWDDPEQSIATAVRKFLI